MSMIVRKQVNDLRANVVARMCDLRNIEVRHEQQDYRGYSSIKDLLARHTDCQLQLSKELPNGRKDRLSLSITGGKVEGSFDTDYAYTGVENCIPLNELLFHPRAANAAGDGYLQAAAYENFFEQNIPVTVQPDQQVDGQWMVGDLIAELGGEQENTLVAGAVI